MEFSQGTEPLMRDGGQPKLFLFFWEKRMKGIEGDRAERSEVKTVRGTVFRESEDGIFTRH